MCGGSAPALFPQALPLDETRNSPTFAAGENYSRPRGAAFHILLGMFAMALFCVAVVASALAISYFALCNDWFALAQNNKKALNQVDQIGGSETTNDEIQVGESSEAEKLVDLSQTKNLSQNRSWSADVSSATGFGIGSKSLPTIEANHQPPIILNRSTESSTEKGESSQFVPHENVAFEDLGMVRRLRQAVVLESERLALEGRQLLENQDPSRAMELFRQAIEMNPEFLAAHLNLGHALRQTGEFAAASTSYRNAARLEPNNARLAFWLASTLALAGQLDESILEYQKSIQLDSLVAEAHNGLGETLYARHLLNKINKEQAKNGAADQRDLLRSIESFCRAVELSPSEPYYVDNLAWARRALSAKPPFISADSFQVPVIGWK
jgi:tetratricopeptide (TPR) repeat protein